MSKGSKKPTEAEEAPAEEISEDEMVARLNEAIGGDDDDDDLEIIVEDDDVPDPAVMDAIISSASVRRIADEELVPPEAEPEGGDEADRWAPVNDRGEPDVEILPTEPPKSPEETWAEVEDIAEADAVIQLTEEAQEDPWTAVDADADQVEIEALAVPSPPPLQLPPPLTLLERSQPGASKPGRPLPWRGTAQVREPELPDLLYVADVTEATTQLLVAAWEMDEDEPGGQVVRIRLADDGPELRLETTGPHEPILACELEVAGERIAVRLALAVGRGERGLRLGRDVLAGRFTVDPSTSDWPKPEE